LIPTNFDKLEAILTEKREELNALVAQFNEKMKVEFTKLTAVFFEETGLQMVTWNQYTPSFNDGDPCTFTLNDAIFVRKGFDPEELLGAEEYEDDDLYGTVEYGYRSEGDPLASVCAKFNKFLHENTDLLEQMFDGDYGTTVYLTKDQTYTAEYDCGY
jgi:hypothetical protein